MKGKSGRKSEGKGKENRRRKGRKKKKKKEKNRKIQRFFCLSFFEKLQKEICKKSMKDPPGDDFQGPLLIIIISEFSNFLPGSWKIFNGSLLRDPVFFVILFFFLFFLFSPPAEISVSLPFLSNFFSFISALSPSPDKRKGKKKKEERKKRK